MSKQNERYYVRFKGRVLGPLAREKALELVNRGQITRQHELSPDGIEWKLAKEFPEFFESDLELVGQKESRSESLAPDLLKEEWFAHFDNNNRGPVDLTGMKNWIALGMVKKETMVWRLGMSEWLPAELIRAEWFSDSRPMESNSQKSHAPNMSVNCPHCQVQLSVNPAHAGSVLPCNSCGGKFQVPIPTANSDNNQSHGAFSAPTEVKEFASKKIAAGICGILLGGLGVHKFILGLTTPATIMLVVWLVGIFSGACIVVPLFASIAMNIIGLVEGIIYLTKSDEDFYQTYAIRKKEWF